MGALRQKLEEVVPSTQHTNGLDHFVRHAQSSDDPQVDCACRLLTRVGNSISKTRFDDSFREALEIVAATSAADITVDFSIDDIVKFYDDAGFVTREHHALLPRAPFSPVVWLAFDPLQPTRVQLSAPGTIHRFLNTREVQRCLGLDAGKLRT
jgi:hypothetical protein